MIQVNQFFLRDPAGQRKSQPRASPSYSRWPDRARGKSFALQEFGSGQGLLVPADHRGNNLRSASAGIPTPRTQAGSESFRPGKQFFSLSVHGQSDSQRRADLSRHVGRHGRGENKGARVVDEMFLQNGASANKRARARQRLPASMHGGGKIW